MGPAVPFHKPINTIKKVLNIVPMLFVYKMASQLFLSEVIGANRLWCSALAMVYSMVSSHHLTLKAW
jgi:hypothetical protein